MKPTFCTFYPTFFVDVSTTETGKKSQSPVWDGVMWCGVGWGGVLCCGMGFRVVVWGGVVCRSLEKVCKVVCCSGAVRSSAELLAAGERRWW